MYRPAEPMRVQRFRKKRAQTVADSNPDPTMTAMAPNPALSVAGLIVKNPKR